MLFNCPLSEAKAERLIDVLDLAPTDRVLDVGCGTGEFLLRVAERYDVACLGIDVNPAALQTAQAAAAIRAPRVSFREVSATALEEPSAGFDLAICMGATHAFALDAPAYPTAVRAMAQWVRPGGELLVGEGVWTATPDPEYVAFLGEHTGVYRSHQENVDVARDLGLDALYCIGTTLDEWDDFEWSHHLAAVGAAAADPSDPKTSTRLAQSHEWTQAYLRWGRGTMGFAYYVFSKSA